MHTKCRDIKFPYLKSLVHRQQVRDEQVRWSVSVRNYEPPDHTDPSVDGKPWADPADPKKLRFNTIDGNVNRKSHQVDYAIDETGRPLNIMGRTGMRGRGILGRWGPNHAADPIVSRIHNGKLQFVAIKRKDSGEWAIPGGMVDAGEKVSEALKREFGEEALGGEVADSIKPIWEKGVQLYAGYVDDPRNTDNAWMETVVFNFHDSEGIMGSVNLQAGDDACAVRWVDADSGEPLYASHVDFIKLLRDHHKL